ncbi:MAG: hypothetical protein AYK23_04385 [Candidatus Proteinoplasmatales archaeon SG8-5]|nr:MAG: hypothetical protein AYK23_04385 [Candidatus Proteinoplasmatales archaeon SG8-5]
MPPKKKGTKGNAGSEKGSKKASAKKSGSKPSTKKQKEEARFENLIDNISDVLVEISSDGKVTYVNQRAKDIYGFEPEELAGSDVFDLIHPDDLEEAMEALATAISDGQVANIEVRTKHKDGYFITAIASAKAIGVGKNMRIVGLLKDVTKSREMLDELKASEERYRAVAEAAQDYIYLIEKDYTYSYVNEAAARLLGTTQRKVVGKKIQDIFPEHVSKRQKKNVRKILQTGEEVYEENLYPVGDKLIWLSARLAPVHDGKGKVDKVLGISRDITKRKEAEIALRDSEEKFRLIMGSSPDAITVSDLTGNIIECNDQTLRIHGFKKKEDIIGRSAFDLIAPEDRERALKNTEITLKEGSVQNLEYALLREDGSEFPGELSANVILNSEGQPISFVAITKDITQRKKMEEEIRHSEEKYSAVVEGSKDAIAIVQDLKVVFANTATAELTGWPVEQLIGIEFKEIVAPEFQEMLRKRFKDRMDGKEVPSFYEIEIITKDGDRIPIEVNNSLITYEGREATLSFVRDITDRKAMEERWRSIAENAPDIVIMLDLEGRITFINRTVTGIKPEDVIGVSQYDYIEKEFRGIVKKTINRVLKTGKPGSYIIKGTGPKGSISWYETQVGPLKEGDNVTGIILFVNDITDRVKYEEALKESEEKYRSLFETSPDSICIIDLEGNILECNEATARITGLSPAELEGKSFAALHSLFEADIEKFQTIFGQLLNDEPLESLELKVIQEGNIRWLESFPTLLKKDGEIYAIQVITRDVTSRKTAEMEMRRQLLKFDVEDGNVYIVKERVPEQSVEIFNELLDVGYLGHVISRRPMKYYTARIDKMFDYAWISEKGSQDSVKPDVKAIEKFIDGMPTRQAILLEGVSYLVSKAGFRKALGLVQAIAEIAYLKDQVVLLSVDPSAVGDKEMRGIEKETSVVTSQMALGKLPDKLLDILKYINKENLTGVNPSFSDVEVDQELSKPTVRKRIRELDNLGCVNIIEKGRNKYIAITEKGKTYMVL